MLALGLLSLFTAWCSMHGPQAGKVLFLGMTKGGWQNLHAYASITAIIFIVLHLLENRRCVAYYMKETIGRK